MWKLVSRKEIAPSPILEANVTISSNQLEIQAQKKKDLIALVSI